MNITKVVIFIQYTKYQDMTSNVASIPNKFIRIFVNKMANKEHSTDLQMQILYPIFNQHIMPLSINFSKKYNFYAV